MTAEHCGVPGEDAGPLQRGAPHPSHHLPQKAVHLQGEQGLPPCPSPPYCVLRTAYCLLLTALLSPAPAESLSGSCQVLRSGAFAPSGLYVRACVHVRADDPLADRSEG